MKHLKNKITETEVEKQGEEFKEAENQDEETEERDGVPFDTCFQVDDPNTVNKVYSGPLGKEKIQFQYLMITTLKRCQTQRNSHLE